jgi:hypothetical protein
LARTMLVLRPHQYTSNLAPTQCGALSIGAMGGGRQSIYCQIDMN